MSPLSEIKQQLVDLVNTHANLEVRVNDFVVPEAGFGDLTLPTFRFAKETKTSPNLLAEKIAGALANDRGIIDSVSPAGPYVNIVLKRDVAVRTVLTALAEKNYGDDHDNPATILLEYVSPNTNKPLHLGHLRNATLGWSLAHIFEASAFTVIKAQIINDRGIHIMKPILAYRQYGKNETPESTGVKGDHLVAKYYVQFGEEVKNDPKLDEEAQRLLLKWEAGDAELRALWEKLRQWTIDGHRTTYERIGISFDRNDFESEIYEDGKKIAREAVERGLARVREDGAIVIDIGEEKEKVLLRSDGTSVYITQDLALAKKRLTEVKPQRMIYVVGQEQDYQFQVLFQVLEKLGIASRDHLAHVSYHHVLLPEGRMKSREGTVVDTDNLLDELHSLAAEEVRKRLPELEQKEVGRRAEIIALAAAKFYMLRVRPNSDIVFNPKESIAFTGHTGPYLLYSYARVQSIFRKAGDVTPAEVAPGSITDSEWRLLMHLASFPNIVREAGQTYNPSLITDFSYTLAKLINDFYEKDPVLKADPEIRNWRLSLLGHASKTLKRSLELLGIETLDEM